MIAPVLAVTLAAVSPLKVASLGFSSVGIDPELAAFYAQHFAQRLADPAVRVITPEDVAVLLGHERQKQLLGCADESTSCIAELAGALGADGVLSGSLARVGKKLSVTIKIIDPSSARPLFATIVNANDEEGLLLKLDDAAKSAQRALVKLAEKRAPAKVEAPKAVEAPRVVEAPVAVAPPEVVVKAPPRSFNWKPFAVLGAGVAVAGAGAGVLAHAGGVLDEMKRIEADSALPGNAELLSRAASLRDDGKRSVVAGWMLVGVGAAAAVAGVVWLVKGSDDAAVAFAPAPGGAMVSISGTFE